MTAIRVLSGAMALVTVAGCAGHSHSLVGDPKGPPLSGQLIHGHPAQRDRLVVERDGKRFEGSFRAERRQDWHALQAKFRGDPKQWARINAGLDRSHEFSAANVELRANDGSSLLCELVWPNRSRPAGACSDADGATLLLEFE